ncbi:uncharacterized protein JN550_004658 [Neoarthrinium moseri]|uniref:uncharacterized protein n=1 Tax=Neoarthrinium moseri TaxID=1658444 RepID=UPI001FDD0310|nr:uncharacterized protein JN550_004658 [Neoarthrinium moseri]KAI1871213.1 hypothetical protein JN550_004658 [Neoarthrinium moseri]
MALHARQIIFFIFSLTTLTIASRIRRYNFTISSKWSAADGHGRPLFAINGQSPGPLIEADEGDEIEVFVDNQLGAETTIHWHGVYQVDKPWNDGVPGVTQYSIQPRDTYLYRFTVQQQYGSYFYHGHFGPAFADVQPKQGQEWIWINFIHSGAHHELQISVDEHEFFVVAADGEFVHPQKVHVANCNLGERISILVRLDKTPGDYAIRVTSLREEQVIQGIGILRYAAAQVYRGAEPPDTTPWVHLNGSLIDRTLVKMDEMNLAPYPKRPPPPTADHTLKFSVNMTGKSSWALNIGPHQAFRQQLPPLLWEEGSRGVTTYGDKAQGLMKNGSVVDIIFSNGANVSSQHPFHKHNNKAWIIGTGTGGFPWASVEDAIQNGGVVDRFNFVDPPLRDGCRLGNETGDWTVIRYQITFPAASMLHCHMIHHFAAGQQVVILEGVESMAPIPTDVKDRIHSNFQPPLRYGPLD